MWNKWCKQNALILNPIKTEEIIFENIHFTPVPITINSKPIKQSSSFKYLGVYVDSALSWSTHVDYICNKVQQRIYFLRRPVRVIWDFSSWMFSTGALTAAALAMGLQ